MAHAGVVQLSCDCFSQQLSGPDILPRAGEPRRLLPRGRRGEMPVRPGLQDLLPLHLLVSTVFIGYRDYHLVTRKSDIVTIFPILKANFSTVASLPCDYLLVHLSDIVTIVTRKLSQCSAITSCDTVCNPWH